MPPSRDAGRGCSPARLPAPAGVRATAAGALTAGVGPQGDVAQLREELAESQMLRKEAAQDLHLLRERARSLEDEVRLAPQQIILS